MGNNPIEGGQYFQGALDEVKIYNKALTAEEVMRLYASGTTGTNDLAPNWMPCCRLFIRTPAPEVHIAHKAVRIPVLADPGNG